MKKIILALALGMSLGGASVEVANAAPLTETQVSAAVGVYEMKWKNGKIGTFTIHAMSSTAANVSYEYGGKSKTKVLKVKGNRIKGGGWFPTLKINGDGSVSASHSGSSATVSKK